jgi:hypothetical protein
MAALGFAANVSFALAGGDDVAASGSGLTLGSGWYTREVLDGRPFHWANNDAQIVIHKPESPLKKISLEVQGGPGLTDAQRFTLHLRSSSNHEIATVQVPGTQVVRFDVPVTPGKDETLVLHVDGGGHKIPKDPRTLDFRIFSLADASDSKTIGAGHPDISSGDLALGSNWYSLEEYGGETFRWVANDAEFTINGSKDEQRRVEITAASGPAVKNPSKWTLTLEDGSGKLIHATQLKERGTTYFDVAIHAGANRFKLHVDSTGAKGPNDPRTLSFRVFNMALE